MTHKTKTKAPITKIAKGGRSLLAGAIVSFVGIEIHRLVGATALWGVMGAAAGLLIPLAWDAWKNSQDDRSEFESGMDKRLNSIEQSLTQKASISDTEEIRSSAAIGLAIAERALKTADKNREIAMNTSDRVNELVTSGVLFTLAQQVTSVQMELSILKRKEKDLP